MYRCCVQRQTAVTTYLKREQLLSFVMYMAEYEQHNDCIGVRDAPLDIWGGGFCCL